MTTIVLTKLDADRVVDARLTDEVCVELEANPTTGFEWQLDRIDGSIKILGDEFVAVNRPNERPVAGMGGVHRFKLAFSQIGLVTAQFKYLRPWQGESSVEIRHSFRISIEN